MERLLRLFLRFVISHPWTVVAIFALVTVVAAVWLAVFRPLSLDTNFTTLLPDDLPCVVESRRISELVGSTDHLIVAIESPVAADNVAFAEDIAERLGALPGLDWVSTREDKSFFRERRLLYLDEDDLREIVRRGRDRVEYEKKIANPFYISLDDEQPPDISFDDIMDRYRRRLADRGAAGLLESGAAGDDEPARETGPEAAGLDLTDRLANGDGTLVSVIARPSRPSTDMTFGRRLVEQTERLIEEAGPRRNPGMRVEVAGAYRNRHREYQTVVGDIYSSLGISLGLILGLIVAFFRRVRTVALIFIPLLIAVVWTVALTALTLGRLNMTTALIFAVLLGLGIDFGVHMSVRYLDERARGRTLEESLFSALVRTGRAILTAGLTTAGGMAVLILARFKGFQEFGTIATFGIALSLLIYMLLLPALAVLMERASVPEPWRKRQLGAIAPRPVRAGPATIGLFLGALAALAGLGALGLSSTEFEYNFRNLRGRNVSTTIKYGKTMGQGSSPVVALMPSPEAARDLSRHLEAVVEADTEGTATLKRVFSVFSFVPDEQTGKLGLLAELGGHVDEALRLKRLPGDSRERLEEIRGWTGATAFGIEDLPDWVKDKFREKDGTLGRIVYLYPRVNEWLVDEMETFYEEFGEIAVPGQGVVRPAATGFVFVEVVRAVKRDGVLMTGAASLVVLVILLVDLRSARKALLVFLPLVVGVLWTGGAMHLLGLKLGIYNMLVLPTLLGIGIDASVHLYHAYEEHGPGSLRYVLGTTGVAIVVAAATTGVGFVGMAVVDHAGLRSIGILAIVGIGCCLAAALLVLPLLLALAESVAARRSARSGGHGR
jgi:hypothetical protein